MRNALSRWRMLALGACVAVAGACNGDSTGTARATTLTAASPQTQTAVAGAQVAEAPAVRVTDQNGQPMANVSVTFQVTGGGGSLVGGTATTNTSGVASAMSWTLGSTPGPNTVSASVSGLAPVTFTATAIDPCDARTSLALGAAVSGALSGQDCRTAAGEYVDYFGVNLASAQAVSFTMASDVVDAYLLLYTANGSAMALNDDDFTDVTTDSRLNVFAPAGGYTLAATSFDAGETGSYQVGASTFAENENCGEYWVIPGVQISGLIEATDCDYGVFADEYLIVLRAGETLTVEMTSNAVDALLGLIDGTGEVVALDDDGAGGTNARLTYTATALEVFSILATTYDEGEVGAYTVAVTRTGGAADVQASERRLQAPARGERHLPARTKPAGR